MKNKAVRILSAILAACAVLAMTSCRKTESPEDTETARDTSGATVESAPASGEPKYTNPLTGLECDTDLSLKRPASIMVNNIWQSLPQEGISHADIMYECLAEGGITRLMMISQEYEKLPQVGSVRSARDYYIDYAQSYDCIFVHAGGSTYAYDTIEQRNIDNIDGVNGPGSLYEQTGTFIRDPERLKTYSREHTLMVQSGEGIKNAADFLNYRTEKQSSAPAPMNFAKWGEKTVLNDKAKHIRVVMSAYQQVDYVYDADSGKYLRYQYDGEPHMDSANNTQLSFENVILMFTETGNISGDEKARIWVGTTGSGTGWYITGGTYQKIKWEKSSFDSVIKYTFEDGSQVPLNRGQTMINVVPSYNADQVVFDDDVSVTE